MLQSAFLLRLLRNHNNNKVETPHTTTESSGGKGLFCRYKLVSVFFSHGNDGGTFRTLSCVLSHFVVGRVSRSWVVVIPIHFSLIKAGYVPGTVLGPLFIIFLWA